MEEKNKKITYWILQLIGWGSYTAFLIYSIVSFSDQPVNSKAIELQLVIGISLFITSHFLRHFYLRFKWIELKFLSLIPLVLFASLIASLVGQTIIHLSMYFLIDWESFRPINWAEIPFYTLNTWMILAFWSIIYFGYHFFKSAQESRIEKFRSEALLKDAELIALKAQINPHFIFNSLNNIRALVLEDPMKARDMISNLSDLLRYSIKFENDEVVTLSEELTIVENYLKLEMVQYENRLQYDFEIDETLLSIKIPPMIIQLQVENAVKHGISQLPDGGTISIKVIKKDQKMFIEVSNTGKLIDSSRKGIGINNAIERIKIILNDDPDFTIREENENVIASLKIPIT